MLKICLFLEQIFGPLMLRHPDAYKKKNMYNLMHGCEVILSKTKARLYPYGCDKKTLLTFYDIENIKYCTEEIIELIKVDIFQTFLSINAQISNTDFTFTLLVKIHILWPKNGLLGNNNEKVDTQYWLLLKI